VQNYAFVPSNLGKKIEKAELVAWEQNTFNVSRGIEYASYEIFWVIYENVLLFVIDLANLSKNLTKYVLYLGHNAFTTAVFVRFFFLLC
jgi:hypothetical protein